MQKKHCGAIQQSNLVSSQQQWLTEGAKKNEQGKRYRSTSRLACFPLYLRESEKWSEHGASVEKWPQIPLKWHVLWCPFSQVCGMWLVGWLVCRGKSVSSEIKLRHYEYLNVKGKVYSNWLLGAGNYIPRYITCITENVTENLHFSFKFLIYSY